MQTDSAQPVSRSSAPFGGPSRKAARGAPRTAAEDQFLTILNNHDKHRAKGFFVWVRGGKDLGALQSLCVDRDRQTWNTCLTVRYRLQSGPALGTLIAAFIADLQRISRGEPQLIGEFAPVPSAEIWRQFLQNLSPSAPEIPFAGWIEAQQGSLNPTQLNEWRERLSNASLLPTGRRLVLFGEILEPAEKKTDGDSALPAFLTTLPERVGLVLHASSTGFSLPESDVHFLRIDLPEEPAVQDPDAVVIDHLVKYRPSAFVSDVPARDDYLDVNDYAESFARFILHPQTKPPLTIGIQGRWGKGKSSFMELIDIALIKLPNLTPKPSRLERMRQWIRARLSPQKPVLRIQEWADAGEAIRQQETEAEAAPEAERPRRQRQLERTREKRERLWQELERAACWNVLTVRFNAWQSEDAKQIWAGLAQVVSERLEGALSWHERILLRVRYAWKERRSELLVNLLLPVLVLWAAFWFFSAGGGDELEKLLDPDELKDLSQFRVLLPAGSILFLAWLATSRILKVVQPVSERVLSYMQLPSYREQMGYQHRVLEDLRFVHSGIKWRWPDCKVVVFIDDLDRCSEEKIMEVLQAINLILGGSHFFVFLGMDTEMIYRAIRVSYRKNQKHEPLPANFPESYLRKIVQLSFHLPETPQEKRFTFLSTLFSPAARSELEKLTAQASAASEGPAAEPPDPSLLAFDLKLLQKPRREQWQEIEDTADELKAFRDYQAFLEDNPREIKRLINVHRLIKIFLQRQNTAWPPDRQRKLVKWLIFCTNWSDLIDDVFAELESPSENCLATLAGRLSMTGERAAAHRQFKAFAGHLDKLATQDIDEDFIRAARISQMIGESQAPAAPPPPPPSLHEV